MIYGHGDDLYRYETEVKYNFSSNVYFEGCDQRLLQHLEQSINVIQHYPSPIANELAEDASHHHQLKPANFLFTNGATEAFYLIAKCFENESATLFHPTFAEYEDACTSHHISLQHKTIQEVLTTNITTKLAFICNPNNPDGTTFSVYQLEQVIEKHPHTTFIIDEAYIEFTQASTSCISLINHYKNLLIVKSLTKTFVIPGLRIGYVISNLAMIQQLVSHKMPWTVNTLAIRAGRFIFANYAALQFDSKVLLKMTKEFQEQLRAIKYLDIQPSECSYFLVKLRHGSVTELKDFLIEHYYILIRDASNFRGLNHQYFRLSTQSITAQNQLITALNAWNK